MRTARFHDEPNHCGRVSGRPYRARTRLSDICAAWGRPTIWRNAKIARVAESTKAVHASISISAYMVAGAGLNLAIQVPFFDPPA